LGSISVQIAGGSDDGTMDAGLLETSATLLNLSNTQTAIWLRFTNVTLAQAATITAATITLIGDSSSSTLQVQFSPQAADNAGALSVGEDGSARTWGTTGANAWDIPALSSGTSYTSPDISDVIQQIVNRGGWSSGNAMLIRLVRSAAGAKGYNRKFRSADNGSTPKLAQLDVTYADASGQPTRRRFGGIHHAAGRSDREGVGTWFKRASGLFELKRTVLVLGH